MIYSNLNDFLNDYPISASICFELSQVNRTTFQRWMKGQTPPPAATIELFKIHAHNCLSTISINWHGWTFNNGKIWTPTNRGFEAHEVEQIPMFYRDRARLHEIEKNYALQSKLF